MTRSTFWNNMIYRSFKNPKIYYHKLLRNTLIVGALTYLLSLIVGEHKDLIPFGVYSLVGFTIGLLLVFRTNTAYDRWWKGRERICKIQTSVSQITRFYHQTVDKWLLGRFVRLFKIYLISGKKEDFDDALDALKACYDESLTKEGNSPSTYGVDDIITDMYYCKMIKETPIPFAYAIHIKFCIHLYVMSLPFTNFYSMGIYSVFLVMALYYIISGVEIISNEIEDPFAGEPNDLPIDELFDEILNELE